MRQSLGNVGIALALMGIPAVAAAQHSMDNPKHELGVDLGVQYSKESCPTGLTCDGVFSIGTPVDVRIGFVSSGKLEVEPRFTFNYISSGGSSLYIFTPDINLLVGMSSGNNKKGPYFTVGAGVNLAHASGSGSATQFNVNGGIGTRAPYESGAFRLEAFARYLFKNQSKGLLNTFQIGGRIGLSLWH